MPGNDPAEFVRAVNRYVRSVDRLARRERRMKWALVAGTVVMGVWAMLMLLSLP